MEVAQVLIIKEIFFRERIINFQKIKEREVRAIAKIIVCMKKSLMKC